MNKVELSDNDKLDIIDKIIKILPEIKKKRTYIINQIITVKNSALDEYVLEKVNINGKSYYRDKYKCILDANAELVGVWEWDYSQNKFHYYIFNDEKAKILI